MREYRLTLILTTVLLFVPMVLGLIFWSELPDTLITHWGVDGAADGFSTKAFAVFGITGIFFALQALLVAVTLATAGKNGKNRAAIRSIFWIVPLLSIVVQSVTYGVAKGNTDFPALVVPLLFGFLFVVLGNYMPKVQQNHTLGVKIYYTLANEENWNRTHRFTGKVWVLCGALALVSALLPNTLRFILCGVAVALAILLPYLYSFLLYKKHKEAGVVYEIVTRSKAEKRALQVAKVAVPLILAGVCVLMFTGKVETAFGETSMTVEATYAEDLEIAYEKIDSVTLVEAKPQGTRTYGFASAKFALGAYTNEALGAHTRYTYNGVEAYLKIESEGKILLLNASDEAQTHTLYETLLTKI